VVLHQVLNGQSDIVKGVCIRLGES
jgi:hypothetical protein